MDYPISLSFKILALAPQLRAFDPSGQNLLYVKQKLLKLKEHVEVFTDDTKSTKLCDIKADRVIDWSANYSFTQPDGNVFGGVRRKGTRSLWRAHYEIFESAESDDTAFTVREEKPFAKVMDGIFGQIPLIGALSGYVFHPSYLVTRPDGTEVIRLKKLPAFFEGKFEIEKLAELENDEHIRLLVSLLMVLLLERARG